MGGGASKRGSQAKRTIKFAELQSGESTPKHEKESFKPEESTWAFGLTAFESYLWNKVDRTAVENYLQAEVQLPALLKMSFPSARQYTFVTNGPGAWRLHIHYGGVYSVHSTLDGYHQHQDKEMDGFIDPRYITRRKTAGDGPNGELQENERPRSRKEFLSRMMHDNSIFALAVRGNQTRLSPQQDNRISVDYTVLYGPAYRLVILAEGEGPFASEMSHYCANRAAFLFQDRYHKDMHANDLSLMLKLMLEDLQKELMREDPNRNFDSVLSGCAILVTVLRHNLERNYSFYTATLGPLGCFVIDKQQKSGRFFNSMFSLANKVVLTSDTLEKERIFASGGEVAEQKDFRINAAGMDIPNARFSRSLGHSVGQLIGVVSQPLITHLVFEEKELLKVKFLLLSSQLQYLSATPKFQELFVNFKGSDEDLKAQLIGIMKGLEKKELITFEDYGLVFIHQNSNQ